MALSTMTVGPPLTGSTEDMHEDITRYCWPSYQRTSGRVGGDLQARFSFSAPTQILERWFEQYLMYEFNEWYGGDVVFTGYISEMRLRIGNDVFVRSMDHLYNSIQVTFTSISNNTDSTAFIENQLSIDTYGKKQTTLTAPEFMGQDEAEEWGAQELGLSAFPRTFLESGGTVAGSSSQRTLEVTVYGWVQTLDWVVYNSDVTGDTTEEALDVIIRDMLLDQYDSELPGHVGIPHQFISPGRIDPTYRANGVDPLTTKARAERVQMWSRIRNFERLNQWALGCFGSRDLDFFAVDTIIQRRSNEGGISKIYLGHDEIPPAKILPYGYFYAQDRFPEQLYTDHSSDLVVAPGVARIDSIQFSQQGTTFSTSIAGLGERKAQLSSARFLVSHYMLWRGGLAGKTWKPGEEPLEPPEVDLDTNASEGETGAGEGEGDGI